MRSRFLLAFLSFAPLACSDSHTEPLPSEPYVSISVKHADLSNRRIVAEIRNIAGETLLIPVCLGGVQAMNSDGTWSYVDDGRNCPYDVYSVLGKDETVELDVAIPSSLPACEYRVIASAAVQRNSGGEPALIYDKVRSVYSSPLCLREDG